MLPCEKGLALTPKVRRRINAEQAFTGRGQSELTRSEHALRWANHMTREMYACLAGSGLAEKEATKAGRSVASD